MTTKFRYVAYAPNGPAIGDVPVPVGSEFSSPMNEVSASTFSYLPGSAGADLLSDFVEIAVEASFDNGATWVEIPNGRYMRRDRDYEKIGLKNVRKYTLPGYGWQLNKAIQGKTTGLNEDGKRPFLSATVGTILKTLIDEAQSRTMIPGMSYDFDTGVDSAGVAWDKIITIYYEPGLKIYQILDNLAQQGMCDWRFQGRTLQVYNADTVMGEDLSAAVRLQPGVDIKALPVKASIENLINHALIIGDGGMTIHLDNPAAVMPWGNWESSISNAGVSDIGTMMLLGQSLLDDGGTEKVQFTCELKMDTTTYKPFGDFLTGHYISGPNEEVAGFQPYRVRQINGRSDKDGKFQVDLIVNDRFVEREIRNAKKTNGIVGGASAGGSGGRPTPPGGEGQDKRQPSAVSGLVLDTEAYIDHNGQPAGIISANWAAVTTATDTTAIDVEGYQVAVRPAGGAWKVVATVDGTSWAASPYVPAASYDVRVRAIGEYTTKPGVWSAFQTVVVASDVTPPAIPSTPILDSRLGIITVTWDGLNDQGAGMDVDLDRIEIAMGVNATPTGVIGNLYKSGMLQVPDQPYNEDRYFRFRSVDTSDNRSEWSVAAGPIAATSVAQEDIDQAVNDAIDQALTGPIDGDRLQPWTVPGDRILIANVTNALPNGNFEDGLAAWIANPRATIVTTTPHSGTQCVEIIADPSSGTMLIPEIQSIEVEPGSSWRFSAWVRTTVDYNGTSGNGKLRIGEQSNSLIGAVPFPVSETWVRVSINIDVPDDGSITELRPTWVADHTVGTLWVDDVSAVRMTDAQLVVDGSITADKMAADSVTANAVAAGAIDGMIITGTTLRTAATGTRINIHGTGGFPGIWLYDTSPNWRITLQVNDTGVPGLWLRDSAGVELMRILALDGGYIRSSFPSGRTALYLSQGQFFVYSDEASFPDIFRTYWNSGQKLAYFGHESNPIDFFTVWGDNVTIRSTSGLAGSVTVSSRGTDGISLLSYTVDGSTLRAWADISTVRIWLAEYDISGNVRSRINMQAGDITMRGDDNSGDIWLITGTSTGKIYERIGGATFSADRVIEIANDDHIIAEWRAVGLALYSANAVAGDTLVRRSTDGRVGVTSSSRRWKTAIEPHTISLDSMRALEVRSWQDTNELEEFPDTTNRYVGFIAEEVHDAGLMEAVMYDPDGTPRNLSERALIAGLVEWNKHLEAEIAALKSGESAPVAARTMSQSMIESTGTGDIQALPVAVPPPPKPKPIPPGLVKNPPTDRGSEMSQARMATPEKVEPASATKKLKDLPNSKPIEEPEPLEENNDE